MAKTASELAKAYKAIKIRGGFVEGSLLSAEQVDALAKLPSREQLLAQVAGTFASPMSGLGRAMNQIIAKLGYGLQARLDQMKEAG
jgi:large subunit ribosomal protein L10